MRVVERLASEGRLPTLLAIERRGVKATLETVGSSSPVVWTSIATGVRPARHGINWFLGSQGRPLRSTDRRRPAFWNVLSHYARSVGVVSWWVTFPAESVHGYLITPYLSFAPISGDRDEGVERLWESSDPRNTYPSDLARELLPFMLDRGELSAAEVSPLHLEGVTNHVPWVWARDRSAVAVALRQMEATPVETLAVYLQAIDVASHDFSRHVFGAELLVPAPQRVSDDERELAIGRVEAVYEATDLLLAQLIDAAGEETDVIVISDHGWEYDGSGHLAAPPGIFLAAGPHFRNGVEIEDVDVLDVLPTLLRILGVPISERLDGRVLDSALSPDTPAAMLVKSWTIPPVSTVASNRETPQDESMLEFLRSLGYVEEEGAPPGTAPRTQQPSKPNPEAVPQAVAPQ
jgi:hypothetical protein